jgi:hypothetical protein
VFFNDLMSNIEWFFTLHDNNKDGFLTKDEVLQLSESLLVCLFSRLDVPASFSYSFSGLKFIFRNEPGDHVCCFPFVLTFVF